MEGRGHLFSGPVAVRYFGLVAQSGNSYNSDIDQVRTVTHAWHYVATYSMFRLIDYSIWQIFQHYLPLQHWYVMFCWIMLDAQQSLLHHGTFCMVHLFLSLQWKGHLPQAKCSQSPTCCGPSLGGLMAILGKTLWPKVSYWILEFVWESVLYSVDVSFSL